MSTLAEQVVEQLKTDMDNVYDAGYQKGVLASGSATLGIKTGTVDVSGGYNMKIPHGCGKLPLFVIFEVPKDTSPKLNNVTFGFWQRGFCSFALMASASAVFNGCTMQKYEDIPMSGNDNAIKVDETNIVVNASVSLIPATYTWYAIYEV